MSLSANSCPVQGDGRLSLCPADVDADLLERWPHLARPGPQPHNLIAPTFAEQLARALTPRATPQQTARAELVSLIEDVVRRLLLAELPAAVEYLFRREADRGAA